MRKQDFCLGENKGADQLRDATRIVQFLFFLNPKFQASSSFLSLYRPVCVGPGRKPRRPVFSLPGSINGLNFNYVDTMFPNLTDCDSVYY